MSKLWLPSRRSSIIGAGATFITHSANARALIALFGGPPSWVLKGAKVDMDFAGGRYFGGSLASLLSISRASQGTDLLPTSPSGFAYNTFGNNALRITPGLGLLIEEARTNVLLNSTAPVTQTSASLATGTYTLWCNGAGSVTPSGGTATITGAAAATNGAPNTFVVTVAGTVVFTKVGALNAFQCELGAFGTSLIVTAGVTATRAADNITPSGAFLAALQTANPTFNAHYTLNGFGTQTAPSRTYLIAQEDGGLSRWNIRAADILAGPPAFVVGDGVTNTTLNTNLNISAGIKIGVAARWSTVAPDAAVAAQGGNLSTAARQYAGATISSPFIGSDGAGHYLDGYIADMAVVTTLTTNARLQLLSA